MRRLELDLGDLLQVQIKGERIAILLKIRSFFLCLCLLTVAQRSIDAVILDDEPQKGDIDGYLKEQSLVVKIVNRLED